MCHAAARNNDDSDLDLELFGQNEGWKQGLDDWNHTA